MQSSVSVFHPVNSAAPGFVARWRCVVSTHVWSKKASLHSARHCCRCEMSNVSGLAVGGCMLITLGEACSNTPAPVEWVIDVLSFSPRCLCFSLWVWLKVAFTPQDSHSFRLCRGLRKAGSRRQRDEERWPLDSGPFRRRARTSLPCSSLSPFPSANSDRLSLLPPCVLSPKLSPDRELACPLSEKLDWKARWWVKPGTKYAPPVDSNANVWLAEIAVCLAGNVWYLTVGTSFLLVIK